MNDFIKLLNNQFDDNLKKLNIYSRDYKDLVILKNNFESYILRKENSIRVFLMSNNDSQRYIKTVGEYKSILTIYKSGNFKHSVIKETKYENKKRFMSKIFNIDLGYVYFIESEYGWKIGKTKNLNQRMNTFSVKLPFEFKERFFIKTINKNTLENKLHKYFEERKINGEWFDIKDSDIQLYCDDNNYKLIKFSERTLRMAKKNYNKSQEFKS